MTPADVSRLLDVYAVCDPQLRSLLEVLAGSAGGGGAGWWHAYRGLIPPQYRDFISLESQASTVGRWRPRWCRGCSRPRGTPVP